MNLNIAYVRVSTVDQNQERQIQALEKYNIDKWFIEKVSSKDTNRSQLKAMLEFAREGDTIYIHVIFMTSQDLAKTPRTCFVLQGNYKIKV